MELVEHGSLDEWIGWHGSVSESQALTWTLETAHGLQAAYRNGLLHRDVKPGNILLAKDRSAKLVDFGLALMFRREVDGSEDIWATPYYVPPEKLLGQSEDHRSDIYSLGATLYHLLVGRPSFEVVSGSYEELRIAKSKPIRIAEVAPQLSLATAQLVDRMMSPTPQSRPSTYEELIGTLKEIRLGGGLSRSSSLRSSSLRSSKGSAARQFLAKQKARQSAARQSRFVMATSLGLILLALLVGVILTLRKPTAPPPALAPGNEDGQSSLTEEPGTLESSPVAPQEGTPRAFSAARQALLAARWSAAQSGFHEIATGPGESHDSAAFRHWARFHEGLAQLFLEEEEAARRTFLILGGPSTRQTGLDAFFAQASRHLSAPGPVSAEVAAQTPPGSCHAIFLLACGLKNWTLGYYSKAQTHLRHYQTHPLAEEFQWIRDYDVLVEDHLADLEWLAERPTPQSLTDRSAIEQELETLLNRLPRPRTPRAKSWLDRGIAALQERLQHGDPDADPLPSSEESASQDHQKWKALQQELAPLASSFDFRKGLALLEAESPCFLTPPFERALADERHLWRTASHFLEYLPEALVDADASFQITLRNGKVVEGQLTEAEKNQLTLRTASGTLTIALERATPDSLAKMAHAHLETLRDANRYYQVLEALVSFAFLTGLDEVLAHHAPILNFENRPFRQRWKRIRQFRERIDSTPHAPPS